MTALEFADAAMAAPGMRWVRWAADWKRREADCWGLVTLFYRHVHGIDLGPVPQTDIEAGYWARRGDWPECDPEPGAAVFMAWQDGAPRHCGVLLPGGMLLHAEGSEERGGSVRLTRLAAMRRLYLDIRFHRYAGPAC